MKISPLVPDICPGQNWGGGGGGGGGGYFWGLFSRLVGVAQWQNYQPGHIYSQRAFMWHFNHDDQTPSRWHMSWTRFGGLFGAPVWLLTYENLPTSLRDILWTRFGNHLSPLLAPVVVQGQNGLKNIRNNQLSSCRDMTQKICQKEKKKEKTRKNSVKCNR